MRKMLRLHYQIRFLCQVPQERLLSGNSRQPQAWGHLFIWAGRNGQVGLLKLLTKSFSTGLDSLGPENGKTKRTGARSLQGLAYISLSKIEGNHTLVFFSASIYYAGMNMFFFPLLQFLC